MLVQEYLKENGIGKLVSEYNINVKEYGDLLVLNYDQIESPKTEQIVTECRSLILDNEFNVVSRSFDRFLNYGESGCGEELDLKHCEIYEKIDGSLIKLYHYNGEWHVASRGTAYADTPVGAFDLTFSDLVVKASNANTMEEFKELCDSNLNQDTTYIFEITSRENRVVKQYQGYTLWFLAARMKNGQYNSALELGNALSIGAVEPRKLKFDSVEHALEASKELKDLDEGYVIYEDGIPKCKIKSPTHLAVHRIRGEGVLSPKRIMQLVLMNEQDEYLTYFPEDEEFFTPYVVALNCMLENLSNDYRQHCDVVAQKEFALAVKDYPYSSCLFQARKSGEDPVHCFHQQRESFKMKVLETYKETFSGT